MFNCESPDSLKILGELCDGKEEMAWWLLCRQLITHYNSKFIGLGMFCTYNIGVIAACLEERLINFVPPSLLAEPSYRW